MNEEDGIGKILITIISCLIIVASYAYGVSESDHKTVERLIEQGVDPLGAKCTISGVDSQVCALYAVKPRATCYKSTR